MLQFPELPVQPSNTPSLPMKMPLSLALPSPVKRPAEAPPPSPAFIEVAKDYVSSFCKSSRAFMNDYKSQWELLEALYLSQIGIREWEEWKKAGRLGYTGSYSRKDPLSALLEAEGDAEAAAWQSNYIHSPGFIVDNFVDNSWSAIFNSSEYLVLINESGNKQKPPPPPMPPPMLPPMPMAQGPPGSQPPMGGMPPPGAPGMMPPPMPPPPPPIESQFTTTKKLQTLLLEKLDNSFVHSRVYEALQSCVILGTVFAKVYWHSRSIPRHLWKIDDFDANRETEDEIISEGPVIQLLPLDTVLPDQKALHSNVQQWRGIGHTVDRTYEDLQWNFDEGIFNINEKEFKARWGKSKGEESSGGGETSTGLYKLASTDIEADVQKWFTVWEWHGSIPFKGDFVECCASFVTTQGAEDPKSGVMVRLTTRPLLDVGTRPFVCAQFNPRPACLGVGIIEREQDILYQMSQFIGQSQDNARSTSNAMYQLDSSSPAWADLQANNNKLKPGMVFRKLAGDEQGLTPVQLPSFPSQEISNMVHFLSNVLERHTAITDTQQGMSQRPKTATESHILQQQGQVPMRSRTTLFAKSFLRPAFNIALAMIRQMVESPQKVTMQVAGTGEVPAEITVDELKAGTYRVEPTITRQDASQIARAQSIERILPNLANLNPLLQAEGIKISFSELLKQYMELLGIEGVDRIVTVGPPPPPPMPMPPPGMAGPGPPPGPPQGGPPRPGPPPGPPPMNSPGRPNMPPPPGNPPQLVRRGGPLGAGQTDTNALAQFLQLQALGKQGGMPRG